MPSVRIRRNTYVPLADPSPGSSEPRNLAVIFTPPTAASDTALDSTSAAPQPSQVIGVASESQPRPQGRPRASSRVDQHCQSLRLGATREQSTLPGLQKSPSRLSSRQQRGLNGAEPEGRQVDLSVRSDHGGKPGLTGSILSLHSGEHQLEDDHHHDDVVEHLDCIGAFLISLNDASLISPHFRSSSRNGV